MRLPLGPSHLVVIAFGLLVAYVVHAISLVIFGEGVQSFLFWDVNKNSLAMVLAYVSFGLYGRWCYESPILPNEQGIQLFFGTQNGEVWEESNFLFIPRPFWSIWKRVSVMHFSFTVAAQNRTTEGHSVIVFATGRAVPTDAQLMAKISQEGMEEQVLGLSMMAVGMYINDNERNSLLNYQSWDISEHVQEMFGKNNLYGLDINVFTTKVVEVNPETMRQFDNLARRLDMESMLTSLKKKFPMASDVELYAVYASLVGLTPSVMSYIIHGEGNGNIFIGGRDNH